MPKSQSDPLVLKLKFILLHFLHRDRPHKVRFLEHISYRDLKKATDSFRRIISSDPQGITYEAKFRDGSLSVVKEVKRLAQGDEDFYKEVFLLGRLHHRHVVTLRGYSDGLKSFLVFEGTTQGSLKDHLNDPLRTPLSWKTRVQIAIGVAAALEYLHRFCYPAVHHISISSSDIILDENLTPKLSNIGFYSTERYQVESSQLSKEKLELIPRFGTLMLELITGQSSVKESTDLIQLIENSSFGISMDNMIDPDLGNSYNSKELKTLLALARFCIKGESKLAFSISHILRYLQKTFNNPRCYNAP